MQRYNTSNSKSILKSVRIKQEDMEYLSEMNIAVDQGFVHQCVLQLKNEETVHHDGNDIPEFIYGDTATNEGLYTYLKPHPEASRFLFRKYKSNQSFIKELCDPENPLYLKEVSDNLKDMIDINKIKEDIESLTRKQIIAQSELNALEGEMEKRNKEYEELYAKIPDMKKEITELQRITANLSTEEAQKRIKSFYESVLNFTESVLELRKKQPISASYSGLKLELNHINTLKLLGEKAKTDMEYITKEDLISIEKLDEQRKRIKEDMEKEKEEGMKSMDSFMAYNPKKELSKSLDKIDLALKQLNQGIPMDGNTVSFYRYGIATISENLAVPKLLIGNLLKQVDNVDRRNGVDKKTRRL